MGRLIIDGNSVFEIDEECMKRRKVPKSCEIEKYFRDDELHLKESDSDSNKKKQK